MKVVFLSDDFPPASFGGAGISTFEIAVEVKKAGHEVCIITTCRSAQDAGESEYEGLRVIKIASDYHERWRAWVSLYNPPVIREIKTLLKGLKPDVVHANNVHKYLSYHCLKVAKQNTKVVVWTARDAMAISYGKLATSRYLQNRDSRVSWIDQVWQAGKRYNPFRDFFIKYYLSYADLRLAVSDALAEALAQNGIMGVKTLHTGMSMGAWHVSADTVQQFKERHGITHKKVILFGGRLGAGKGAMQAMQLVNRILPDAVLVVMGKGENAEKMRSAAGELPVVFTGWISGEEKVAAYHASDVVWVPSTYLDAFPRSALEASVSRKPVITTVFGGASELVQEGKTGYVVNPLHPEAVADKTILVLQDKEKAVSLGNAGRERVEKEFNIRDKAMELVGYYQTLLSKNS